MSVIIKPGMKGFKFGEFSFTKVYGLKKKKNQKITLMGHLINPVAFRLG